MGKNSDLSSRSILKSVNRAIRRRSARHYKGFCEEYLPHYFNLKPESPVHKDLDNIAERTTKEFDLFINRACPRGFGKTTKLGFSLPLYHVAMAHDSVFFHDKIIRRIIPIISATWEQAKSRIENISEEILENDLLREDFNIRPGMAIAWQKASLQFKGVKLFGYGAGQRIRGLVKREGRPDMILIDDLEDLEIITSQDKREKHKRWFHGTVMGLLGPGGHGAVLIWGTKLHSESVLSENHKNPAWESKIWAAQDKDGEPVWPHHFGVDEINRWIEKNGMVAYQREMMNKDVKLDECPWSESQFPRFDRSTPFLGCKGPGRAAEYDSGIVFLDPAGQKKLKYEDLKRSYACASAVKRWRREDGEPVFDIVDCWMKKTVRTEIQAMETVKLAVKNGIRFIGVEENLYRGEMTKKIKKYIRSKGLAIRVVGVEEHGDKDLRILTSDDIITDERMRLARQLPNTYCDCWFHYPILEKDPPDSGTSAIRLLGKSSGKVYASTVPTRSHAGY